MTVLIVGKSGGGSPETKDENHSTSLHSIFFCLICFEGGVGESLFLPFPNIIPLRKSLSYPSDNNSCWPDMSNIVMKDSEVTLLQFSGLVGTLVPHYLTTTIPIKQTMVCFRISVS